MGRVMLPEDLRCCPYLQVHTLKFDPTRQASGLSLEFQNRKVTKTVNTNAHKCVYATEGFATGSGIHYWSTEILQRAVNGHILQGVSDGTASCTGSSYPGAPPSCGGCSLSLHDGHFYRSGTNVASAHVDLVKKATHIGVLLNMNERTVTFYADGVSVGMGLGSDVMTAEMYYPVVALYEMGHSVVSDDIDVPQLSGQRAN